MKTIRRLLVCSLFVFGANAFPANATFTFTPSSVGLTGAAFTADDMDVSLFTNLTFTGATTFNDVGFLSITGFELAGSPVSAAGLNLTYSLYIQFAGTGHLTTGTSSTDLDTTATSGVFDTLNYSLIGTSGNTQFGFSGNTPTVSPGGATQTLATGSLTSGSFSTMPVSGNTAFVPSFGLTVTFDVAAGKQGFFASPNPFNSTLFFPVTSLAVSSVQPFGAGGVGSGFLINQGVASANFDGLSLAVPEPATLALLGLGLAGIGLTRRRARSIH